jgi:DNA repair exonuclease SbcCD ATPase subunit
MKISALRFFNVRRFGNRGVAIEGIGDGVNVLCAANEFGKSTSFDALHALFFQAHSGTPSDVQRLRPYSGGSPVVEVDISTPENCFRITKQYYAGRSARVIDLANGRLVAQSDEAENFIAGLIKGGTAGPAGLLWVRQGITGIEKRSRSEEDSEKQVRAGLLESVQGEVEAVTGGRRMAEIMAATEEAVSELVTASGKPKTGGRYAVAVDERDKLAAEEQRLSGEVVALREALDKRANESRRLAEIENADDKVERKKAIATAQAAFDAARAQGETLKTAEAELKLVSERRAAADSNLKAFRNALERAKELHEKMQNAEQLRAEVVSRRSAANEVIEKAKVEVDAAEADEQEKRDLVARVEAVLRARETSERCGELLKRLNEADATRHALEEGEAKFALVKIPPDAINELQEIEIELARLKAVEAAARPSVSIIYDKELTTPVIMDGTPLGGGDERGYDRLAQLAVPGIGTITLRSNRPARTDKSLERAETTWRRLLASLGVVDLAAARTRQVEAQQLEAELRDLRGRLSLLAPEGLPKLREEVAEKSAIGIEALELTEDPEQVRIAMAKAEERRKLARQTLREVEPLRANADEDFVATETSAAGFSAELAQFDAILGPNDHRSEREISLVNNLAELDSGFVRAEVHARSLRAFAVDLESSEAAVRRVRSVDESNEKQVLLLRESLAGLNAEIRTRSDEAIEEKWRETVEVLSAVKTRVQAYELEVAVLQRLSSALETARSEARELYLKPVMAELKPLLGLLFDDVSITFDDKTLLPRAILRNGQEEEVERLSGGMREQLSVLTRLAFARLLARDGRPAPVILDDALVYSDDDRIERMFDALHRQSRDLQIIVFSCRQRAFAKLGGNTLRMVEWQP